MGHQSFQQQQKGFDIKFISQCDANLSRLLWYVPSCASIQTMRYGNRLIGVWLCHISNPFSCIFRPQHISHRARVLIEFIN